MERFLSYETQNHLSSTQIVIEAMNKTLEMEICLYKFEEKLGNNSDVNLRQEASYKKCHTGSMLSIYYMYSHYPDFFDQYFVLRSYKQKMWNYHSYFVVRDINGILHAGSPANASSTDNNFPFQQPISDAHVSNLLRGITSESPGVWPDPQVIDNYLHITSCVPEPIKGIPTHTWITEFRYEADQTIKKDEVFSVPPSCVQYFPCPNSFIYGDTLND